MPNLIPLTRDTGSLRRMTASSSLINPIYFPVSKSVSNSYTPVWPETEIILTSSLDALNSSTTDSASLSNFTLPSTAERYFYTMNGISRVKSANVAVGPKITIQSANNADSFFTIKHANSATSQVFLAKGTKDPLLYPSASTVNVVNFPIPNDIKGVLTNSSLFGGTFNNSVIIQTATASQGVTGSSGSYWGLTYAGYSSSIQNSISSFGPLALSASYVKSINGPNDYIDQSVIFSTSSLMRYSKLTSTLTNDFNTNPGTWVEVFNYGSTGNLPVGRKYMMQAYILIQTNATTTGFQLWITGSLDTSGYIYIPGSAVARTVSTSINQFEILHTSSLNLVAGGNKVAYAEFTTTILTGSSGPIVYFRVEQVAAGTATVQSGSLFTWKEIS